MSATPTLVHASATKIMVDGEQAAGVQKIDFSISRNRVNIHSTGTDERQMAAFGPLHVDGTLVVRSTLDKLDKKLYEPIEKLAAFQIVVDLQAQGGTTGKKKISFDECYLDRKALAMDATGTLQTTYFFSAVRVREE